MKSDWKVRINFHQVKCSIPCKSQLEGNSTTFQSSSEFGVNVGYEKWKEDTKETKEKQLTMPHRVI